MDEQTFADGNVSGTVRVGDSVRRESGPWTPAVHALLRHLEQKGFSEAPRPLGFDDRGREVLSFLPGETIPADLSGFLGDNTLSAAAQLLRRYHDCTLDFQPPADAQWRFTAFTPPGGDVICHNDFAPYNTIQVAGRISGLIDWDFATPGSRQWDIAYALWRFAPLYPDAIFGPPTERLRRIDLFCKAYGLEDHSDILITVRQRQMASYTALKTWAEQGSPAFAKMWREGHGDGMLRDVAFTDSLIGS